MNIDFSKFSEKVQAKIKAALNDEVSPDRIDADEIRAMNLSKEVQAELMRQLAGNPGMIGDGFYGKSDNDSTFVFYDKPKNGKVDLSDKAINHYKNKYPDKDIYDGFMQDGVLYFRDSNGEIIKDKDNNYISEKIFTSSAPAPFTTTEEVSRNNTEEDDFAHIPFTPAGEVPAEGRNRGIQFINPDGSINVKNLHEYLNNLPETDENYTSLMKDIEDASKEESYWSITRDLKLQKTRFIEMYETIGNGEFGKAAELMYEYFQADCNAFDEEVLSKIRGGLEVITGAKWAGPALYKVLSFMAKHADNLAGRDENGIGYAQRLLVGVDNFGQGLGDFVFSSEGLMTMGAIATGEGLLNAAAKGTGFVGKIASKVAPYIGAGIHSVFAAQGAELVADGVVKVATGESLEIIAEGGQEVGHGFPLIAAPVLKLTSKGVETAKAKISKTKQEKFRAKCKEQGYTEDQIKELEAYQKRGLYFVDLIKREKYREHYGLKPDNLKDRHKINKLRKRMTKDLQESPEYVELYKELDRIYEKEKVKQNPQYMDDTHRTQERIQYVLDNCDKENAKAQLEFIKFLDENCPDDIDSSWVIYENFPNLMYSDKRINKNSIEAKKEFYELIKDDPDVEPRQKLRFLSVIDENNIEYAKTIWPHLHKYYKENINVSGGHPLWCDSKEIADIKLEIFNKYGSNSISMLNKLDKKNVKTAKILLDDPNLDDTSRWMLIDDKKMMSKYIELKKDPEVLDSDINKLLINKKPGMNGMTVVSFIEDPTSSLNAYKYLAKKEGFPKEKLGEVATEVNENVKDLAYTMFDREDFPPELMAPILKEVKQKGEFQMSYSDFVNFQKEEHTKLQQAVMSLVKDKDFPPEQIIPTIRATAKSTIDYAVDLCANYKKHELLPQQVPVAIYYKNRISVEEFTKLNHKMGKEDVSKLTPDETYFAAKFVDILDAKNLNEVTAAGKKKLLRSLVQSNVELFELTPTLRERFPLLPEDGKQYCGLMRATVKSLGIETNPLSKAEVDRFYESMDGLSESLAELSNEEFAGLKISQEYSREEFIATVREQLKELSQAEKQKVYDYYGFEIHRGKGKNNPVKWTLTGYPVNLNNGAKLAEITDPNTKAVVESLRSDVIRFSENNPIRCQNKTIEKFLNEVVKAMPEIRSMIGRAQHGNNGTKGAHDFDVMQHSLKVMQKITQDPKFKELNESDKKIMLLASLLHDITKAEGISDHTHATEGGFDTFYICKKFKLSEDEEQKLFDLTRLHEWLNFVNKSDSEAQLTQRLQSVAFDMQNDNLFDMALIFTHADLKAVKADDSFHDSNIGATRAVFDENNNRIFAPSGVNGTGVNRTGVNGMGANGMGAVGTPLRPSDTSPARGADAFGVRKSHGETADIYAERIREYIHELRKTRPITPTTEVPTMSKIRSHLKVNPDGSTQFKGVFVDKDGLVVIKVNDVEDWEGIGFPKGTTTKGILATVANKGEEKHQVETGNFKLMMHGLDYPNQLARFDRFSMPDSEEMLSITYGERLETKWRLFRPQGIGLDIDSDHIYGGGETDAGSGCAKLVEDFKRDYIFGGEREGDRRFVSDLIKKKAGIDDEKYIEWYDFFRNKKLHQIHENDARFLIQTCAEGIHSTVRPGDRAYDEFYGSNIKRVNSTWTYSVDPNEKIENPLEFLNRTELTEGEKEAEQIGREKFKPVAERISFLREFALDPEHDVPMLILGD